MYASQPETQMLLLWSSHRRRMVYTVQPVVKSTHKSKTMKRYMLAISLLLSAVFLLAGCVARYPYGGYYGNGRGYGHNGYDRGYYNGYGNAGRGYGHYRHHHHDDDD